MNARPQGSNGAPEGPPPRPGHGWRARKVSQNVAMAVVEEIVTRGLRSGDRLPPEAEMTERFEISRASLREGLRVLETYGVIRIRQGQRGGPEIGSLSPADLARTLSLFFRIDGATYRDVLNARLLIVPVMARIGAEAKPPKQISALRSILALEPTASDQDYVQVANSFHQLVSGLSGNAILDLLGQALWSLYAQSIFRAPALLEKMLASCRDAHPYIGAAILDGDGERAEAAVAQHLAELNRYVSEGATWFMDDRIAWEA